jgi:hypothetical protein
MAKINITSPVGRIVMGSLFAERTTDAEGKPLVVKSGPNAGKPRVDYFFALAIPKEPGHTHWAQTAWGQQIWALGHQAFPQAAQAPDFSWKISDGDSRQPGKLFKGKPGKPPCENEGWPGCWVLKFSGGFAPKVYRQENGGYVQVINPNEVKTGYYGEVAFSADGNGSQTSPGIYLNHSMFCFRAFGPEINFGPDAASAGFGQAPLPAGASMTPLASTTPLPAAPVAPGYAPPPLPPGGFVPPVQPPAPAAPAIPVSPIPGFLQVPPPAIPGATVAPPPAPQPPAHQMTALANGLTYEAYRAAGWTDAQLVQNGMMLA